MTDHDADSPAGRPVMRNSASNPGRDGYTAQTDEEARLMAG